MGALRFTHGVSVENFHLVGVADFNTPCGDGARVVVRASGGDRALLVVMALARGAGAQVATLTDEEADIVAHGEIRVAGIDMIINSDHRGKSDIQPYLLIGGLVLFGGLKIWDGIDGWIGPPRQNHRYRELLQRTGNRSHDETWRIVSNSLGDHVRVRRSLTMTITSWIACIATQYAGLAAIPRRALDRCDRANLRVNARE